MSILGSTTDSWSYENSQGYGETNASSFQNGESQSSSYNNTDAWSKSSETSKTDANSWSQTYGSEASAKDIQRAKDANELEYKWWKEANKFNASEAEKQRKFEESMAKTSYQRAVVDMMKAGINPILSAMNGGAAVPTGSAASTSAPSTHKANTTADEKSKSTSKTRSSGQSASSSTGRAASQATSFNVGGSTQHGVNVNISNAESGSKTRDNINNIMDGIIDALKPMFGYGSSTHGYGSSIKGGGGGDW